MMIRLAIHNMIRSAAALYRYGTYRAISIAGSALLLIALLSSCYRDDLCFLHPVGARIRVVVHYEAVGLTPDKSYLGIYNADNQELIRQELMSDPSHHELSLEVGRYIFIVYNEPIIEDDYATAHSVDFSDMSRWDRFKTFAVEDPTHPAASSPKSGERTVVAIEDQLAVGRYMEFEVTPDMVSKTHYHPTRPEEIGKDIIIDTTLYMHPRRVFTKINLELQVRNYPGWTLRRNNGSRPRLYGSSESYLMGLDRYTTTPTTQFIDLINRGSLYSGSTPTTRFSATFYSVGLPDNELPTAQNGYPYTLFFRFEHGSASSPLGVEIRPITVDMVSGENADIATMRLTRAGQPYPEDGKIYPNDILDIAIQLTLPERIPIGEDAEVDIEDWNNQDVPLDSPPTLHFHPNGAVGNAFAWRYPVGTLLFLPVPTSFTPPNDHRFKEWNSRSDGSGVAYQPVSSYPMPRSGGTLYAIWEKK